jgi:hypothetical protein
MNRTWSGLLRAQMARAIACAMRVFPDFAAPKISWCGVECMLLYATDRSDSRTPTGTVQRVR